VIDAVLDWRMGTSGVEDYNPPGARVWRGMPMGVPDPSPSFVSTVSCGRQWRTDENSVKEKMTVN
jgi:hypothetical protein